MKVNKDFEIGLSHRRIIKSYWVIFKGEEYIYSVDGDYDNFEEDVVRADDEPISDEEYNAIMEHIGFIDDWAGVEEE
jgi:hypothetical protein